MRYLLILMGLLTFDAQAADLTERFKNLYQSPSSDNKELQKELASTEIILVPGINAELFLWEDTRGVADFSLIMGNYFEAQRVHFNKMGIPATRVLSSSYSVAETRRNIALVLEEVLSRSKSPFFVTHSLGGLALLDYLLKENPAAIPKLKGIVFIQSPFKGSPVANVYEQNPYYAHMWLRPLLPFVNTSEETINYLRPDVSEERLQSYGDNLAKLIERVPMITAAGVANRYKSLFTPSINIIAKGCLTVIRGKCRSKKLFQGPYDYSDGMVPFESSKLPGVDHVKLKGVDHGETVMNVFFNNIDRVLMTDVLVKMVLEKR